MFWAGCPERQLHVIPDREQRERPNLTETKRALLLQGLDAALSVFPTIKRHQESIGVPVE
jgi:hypothetical protein